MFEDYHVHSEFSDDSDYPMEQVIRDAIEMGMDELCFTDHVDYGIKSDWDEEFDVKPVKNVNYPVYFDRLTVMRKKYGQDIQIRGGLEFGVQTHTIPAYQKLYSLYKSQLDFVLLSVHEIDDQEFWTQDFQRGKTQEQYNRSYYQELLDIIRDYKDYSVLAHLDLISRYDPAGEFPFEDVQDLIAEILTQVIADGKGIEINTSSVRYGLNDSTPCRKILEMYRDLGGRVLTFGSDSHHPDHLGKYIQESKKMARDLGFEEYCTFESMEPIFHSLD